MAWRIMLAHTSVFLTRLPRSSHGTRGIFNAPSSSVKAGTSVDDSVASISADAPSSCACAQRACRRLPLPLPGQCCGVVGKPRPAAVHCVVQSLCTINPCILFTSDHPHTRTELLGASALQAPALTWWCSNGRLRIRPGALVPAPLSDDERSRPQRQPQ